MSNFEIDPENNNIPFKRRTSMALQRAQGDEFGLGFTVPAAGVYVWQFLPGIKVQVKEGPGRSIVFPMQIVEIVKGDDEAIMSKHLEFVTIITKEDAMNKKGEETVGMFLDYTGLYNEAAAKFGENVDLLSDPFIGWLNLKLASKTIRAEHTVEVNKTTKKDQMRFSKFFRSAGAGGASAGASSPTFE